MQAEEPPPFSSRLGSFECTFSYGDKTPIHWKHGEDFDYSVDSYTPILTLYLEGRNNVGDPFDVKNYTVDENTVVKLVQPGPADAAGARRLRRGRRQGAADTDSDQSDGDGAPKWQLRIMNAIPDYNSWWSPYVYADDELIMIDNFFPMRIDEHTNKEERHNVTVASYDNAELQRCFDFLTTSRPWYKDPSQNVAVATPADASFGLHLYPVQIALHFQ